MLRRLVATSGLVVGCVLYLSEPASAQTGTCFNDSLANEVVACADGISEAACPYQYTEGQTCAERGEWDGACTIVPEAGAPECLLLAENGEAPSFQCASQDFGFGGVWEEGGTCVAAEEPVSTLPSSSQATLLALMLLAGLAILAFRSRRATT